MSEGLDTVAVKAIADVIEDHLQWLWDMDMNVYELGAAFRLLADRADQYDTELVGENMHEEGVDSDVACG